MARKEECDRGYADSACAASHCRLSSLEMQSPRNKVDELQACVKFIPKFKNAWFLEHDMSQDFEILTSTST